MPVKLKAMFSSRRFWVAVGGIVTIALQDILGIPDETAVTIVTMGIAWIVGDSVRGTE